MVEATEIAKLRLFLKMVAVVEVDLRAENLGLDPLPDIDFNIRCGNTLVGYATEKELANDLIYGDMHANKEFRKNVEEGMDKAAHAFKQFKAVQFKQEEDMEAFKNAKDELRKRLEALNNDLNHRLYASTTDETVLSFDEWKASHQPFHWLAEFYEIIHGNGGFDVVIGNPPYVVYNEKSYTYKVPKSYYTYECANLYAFVLDRCLKIMSDNSCSGYIIPISSVSNDTFIPLQKLLLSKTISWFSSYSNRPGKLFDKVEQRLTIAISRRDKNAVFFASKYYHWSVKERNNLFNKIFYYKNRLWDKKLSLFKIGSVIEENICKKLYYSNENLLRSKLSSFLIGEQKCYYHNAPTYFIRAMAFKPNNGEGMKDSSHYKCLTTPFGDSLACILNSSLYYWFFKNVSNCRDYAAREIQPFPIGDMNKLDLDEIGSRLKESYISNRTIKNRIYPSGIVYYEEYYPAKSKLIIDEIDKVLAKHYGFTEEELDFIINYDIKYRMGEELNEE